jgi:hypothetical protein
MKKKIVFATAALALTAATMFALGNKGPEKMKLVNGTELCGPGCCEEGAGCGHGSCDDQCCD